MSTGTPDRQRLAVWKGYLRSYTTVMRALERELQTAHALSIAEYDVLIHLHNAPAQRARMGDLAEAVLFSTGGLTRLLDRLECAGLVARERTPADRRGVFAVLTEAGRTRLRAASVTHLRGIQEHFAAALHEDEIAPVEAFLARLNARASVLSDTSCVTEGDPARP